MEKTLLKFTNSDLTLFDASEAFLKELGIRYNRGAETSTTLNAIAPEKKIPKSAQEALNLLTATYFVGNINSKTFEKDVHFDANLQDDLTAAEDEHYKGMFVFAVDLKADVKLTRTFAATLTRAFNRVAKQQPVVLFIRQNTKLSIATCERTPYKPQWLEGEKLGKVSVLMNVDCEKPHRGHINILESMQVPANCNSFDELYEHWIKVFSSNILRKNFYTGLFKWYQWVALDKKVEFSFPNDLSDETDDAANNLHITRLITRLMFVWFLKQMNLVPSDLFDKAGLQEKILKDFDPISNTDGSYYNAILQNLFFATLNQEIKDRAFTGDSEFQGKSAGYGNKTLFRDRKNDSYFKITHDKVLDLFNQVPYLNGGLFDCLDKTDKMTGKVYYYDGFSREEKKQAHIPNVAFFDPEMGLIPLFEKYHFTIEENTPYDEQVALDPELLGKVFENLLAYINPDDTGGKESARKASGSYYTPREIVNYMVDESLVAHLKTKVGDDERLEKEYRKLIAYGDEKIELTKEEKKAVTQAIFECKILDPACGSGAFPMGMLQQLVHVLEKLDKDNVLWKEVVKQQAAETSASVYTSEQSKEEREERLAEIEETFSRCMDHPDYTRKLYLIENCIYGVDIQPVAIQISKLRFFISLVISQAEETNKYTKEQNYGIQALPNLGTKFVCANTLIPAELKQYEKTLFDDDALHQKQQELLTVRHQYFYAKREKKKLLASRDEQICQEIGILISASCTGPDEKRVAIQQAAIDSLEKEVIKIMSMPQNRKTEADLKDRKKRIKQAQRIIEQENKKSKPAGFDKAVAKLTQWDPYDAMVTSPFFDPEWMFGIKDGFDIVIGNPPYVRRTSLSDYDKDNYEKLYSSAKKQYDLYLLFIEKGITALNKQGYLCYINPIRFFNSDYGEGCRKFIMNECSIKSIMNVSQLPVFDAMTYPCVLLLEKGSTKDNSISYYHPNELSDVLNVKVESALVFPQSTFNSENCIFIIPVDSKVSTVIAKIDNGCEHISDYFDVARGLPNNKVDFKGMKYCAIKSKSVDRYRILGLELMIDTEFADKFALEMVIMPRTVLYLKSTLKKEELIPLDRIYYLTQSKNKWIDNKYTIGIINSKLTNFWFEYKYSSTKVSGNYFDLNGKQIKSIPLPSNKNFANEISNLVSKILEAQGNVRVEQEIDHIVYHLYNLTYDEVLVVDPETPITREEYDNFKLD